MAKSEIIKRLMVLGAMFPNVNLRAENYEAYASVLMDIPTEILDVACQQAGAECKFFPSVAELRERALKMVAPERPTAADAWGTTLAAIRRIGWYGKPDFADPILARTVEIMDWKQLCCADLETIGVTRAQFMRIYEQLVQREADENRLTTKAREMRERAGRADLSYTQKVEPKELPEGDLVGPTPEYLEALEKFAGVKTMRNTEPGEVIEINKGKLG